MKIAEVETLLLSIPFTDGGKGEGLTPGTWNTLETVLVRVVTEDGIEGWGEAFGYFCGAAVKAMLDRSVVPLLIGRDFDDPAEISGMLQRRLALFGRYGITIFALSGVDLALWDIKARAEGVPLHRLIGPQRRAKVPAYASLVRYGDPQVAAGFTERAVREGYRHIKLHEITRPDIEACYAVRGDAEMMVDVNCSWSAEEAYDMAAWLAECDTLWLEEPTFPPEDMTPLAEISRAGVALSGGENLCTSWQFRELIASGLVRYPQPSVTKVGGLSEMMKVLRMAEEAGLSVMPHSPYFGPGYFATLHVCATLPEPVLFEHLYVWPDAYLYADMPLPVDGEINVPDAHGLAPAPDPETIRRYRIA